ncbi:MAG: LytR/AlgR family response regulator transcription factor [Sarcina sp.]
MIKVGICDNNKEDREFISQVLEEYCIKNNLRLTFESYDTGMKLIESKNIFHFVILDTNMDEECGVNIAKRIKEENPNTEVIFLVENQNDLLRLFEVNPFTCLMKPIEEKILIEQVDKVAKKLGILNNSVEYLTIKKKYSLILVNPKEIMYIEVKGRILTIHCTYEDIEFYGKIESFLEEVNKKSKFEFIKCHRSYAINPYYVRKVEKIMLTLTDGSSVPMSRVRYEEVEEKVKKYHNIQ